MQKDEVSTYYPIFINYNKFIGFETEFIGSSLLTNETNAKRRIRVVCEGLPFFNAVSDCLPSFRLMRGPRECV